MIDVVRRSSPWQARLVLTGAALAICLSAFEVRTPAFSLGPVSFTISELAVLFFFFTVAVYALAEPGWFFSRRVLDLAVLLFIVSNFISIPAAGDRGSAFKFALRMTFAALVYVGVSRLPARVSSHLLVAGAVSVTIIVVTIIGCLENLFPLGSLPKLLSPWQEGTFSFGPFYNVRISSTLPFPTVLSMYLELALPIFLTLGLWLTARAGISPRRRLWFSAALITGLAAMTTVQILTYTRTALVAMPVAMLVAALLAGIYRYGKRVAVYFILVVIMLGLVLASTALFGNVMSARLGIDEPVRLYTADYTLISMPVEMGQNQEYSARVRITNTSDGTWEKSGDNYVAYSYRWLNYPEKERQDFHYQITNLPKDIVPGETVEMDVTFFTPDIPGRYILIIEPFRSHVGMFSGANTTPLVFPLELVDGVVRKFPIPETAADFVEAPVVLPTPDRGVLWRAAWRIWKEHPVLGVGPGQFRKVYSNYSENITPDEHLETHNIFLEALANTGVVGLAAMLFLLASAIWYQFRLVRSRSLNDSMRLLSLGLLAALVAYVTHGFLDFFLWQNGVTFLFFTLLGLTAWLVRKERDGERGKQDLSIR
ncbi:MAG: O-antigen ligase family protein [Thermoleophilia bacterium]|nr:O-antigen ligase family protein [Thermoleophilia bacterium]